MRRTQLICSRCGCESVTVYGEQLSRQGKDCSVRDTVTMVRCDQCGHQGPTRSFFRVRLRRIGPNVRLEVQYTFAGKQYKGELRARGPRGFWFVGTRGSERLEVWSPRDKLVLL